MTDVIEERVLVYTTKFGTTVRKPWRKYKCHRCGMEWGHQRPMKDPSGELVCAQCCNSAYRALREVKE